MNLAYSLYLFGLLSIAMIIYPRSKYIRDIDIYNFLNLFIYVFFILLGITSSFIAINQGIYDIPFSVLLWKGCVLTLHHIITEHLED